MIEESSIITRLKQKDASALSTLYDKYAGAIYGVILRMCRDENLAQNLLQDTFLKVWEKSYQYDPDKGRFYTWVYRIARNNVLNALRKENDLIQNSDLSVYTNKEADVELDFEDLNGGIRKLEPHHKQAIDLIYFKGLTHREAHAVMDVPLGTFKSYIRQALKQLREHYEND
ncbi:MAG: sigma-70 family RNA polymerase sigma factor [Flavobacteriaceae bacterium]|nr:sigma-70 family RNA polymerase sigma factor [Flavobacteriaceae bacterium]